MSNFRNQASWNTPPPSPRTPQEPPNNNNSNNNNNNNNIATSNNNLGARRTGKNPVLDTKLQQMALPLAPLVQLTSGQVHSAFPQTLLNFWLLTEEQLEEIAQFYHQRTPCQWTRHYPCPIQWSEGLTMEEKRRKIGKFIGLRGCETPMLMRTCEQIEAEARKQRVKDEDNEMMRRKMQWY